MDVLGVTVLVSALPRILRGLGAPISAAGVVATSYAMAFGGLLLLGARLGDRCGYRRVLLAGLGLFAAASALAGCAQSLAAVVAGRFVQGAAAAISVPAALRLISEATSGEESRRRALGAWSAAGAAAGASGLLVGGLLAAVTGWRAVFWLNVPLAAGLALAVFTSVPAGPRGVAAALAIPGAALLTAAVMALILACALIEHQSQRGAGAACGLGGTVLLAAFARRERATRHPLLPVAALRDRRLRAGARASFLNTATTSSVVTVAALYLQTTRHTGPATAGLMLLPFSLCVIAGAALAGRRLAHRDPRLAIAAGLGLIALGDGGLLLVPAAEPALPIGVGITGLGIGLSSVGATAIGTDVAANLQGAAAGLLNTAAQLGTALGVSAAVLLAGVTAHSTLPLRGPALAWAAAALLAAAGALAGTRFPGKGRHAPRSRQRRSVPRLTTRGA
jgi:MFS family permease